MKRLSRYRLGHGWLLLLVATLISALVAACGGGSSGSAPTAAPTTASAAATTPVPTATPTVAPLKGSIIVFAAASLTDAFNEMGKSFQAAHPGTNVAFNYASSSSLAVQINQGAPADVFASADTAQMKVVSDAANAGESQVFVTNLPVVVVPKGDSAVSSFQDLAKPGIKLILAAKEVPIGNYARQILEKASASSGGISPDFGTKALANLKSNEADVRAVLAKIQVGEADAGIVYTTDAAVAGSAVRTLAIPAQYNVIATYPIATVKTSKNQTLAQAFVAYVLSKPGQAILQKYGFAGPG